METRTGGVAAPLSRGAAYGLLGAVVVLWGVNWPVMKVGLDHITPLWFAVARVMLGAACLFALLSWRGRLRLPTRADWPVVLSVAALQIALALALINLGLDRVEAGRSAMLAYTTPLWVTPLAALFLGEVPGVRRLSGLVFGLAGVAVLFNPTAVDLGAPGALAGHAFLLGAALTFAVAIIHMRAHAWTSPPLALMPWQMLIGGLLLLPVAVAVEGAAPVNWSWDLALVLAYNGPIGSAFCFWAYVSAARSLPALDTALGSLGVPVVGLVSSALVLGEPLGWSKLGALALICLGVGIVTTAEARPAGPGA